MIRVQVLRATPCPDLLFFGIIRRNNASAYIQPDSVTTSKNLLNILCELDFYNLILCG